MLPSILELETSNSGVGVKCLAMAVVWLQQEIVSRWVMRKKVLEAELGLGFV